MSSGGGGAALSVSAFWSWALVVPGLVGCGVVLGAALPSGNAFFAAFDRSLQGTVYLGSSTLIEKIKI